MDSGGGALITDSCQVREEDVVFRATATFGGYIIVYRKLGDILLIGS